MKKGILWGALAAVLLIGLVIFFLRRDSRAAKDGPVDLDEAKRTIASIPGFGQFAEGEMQERALISAVDVERPVICAGEDVLVRVKTDPSKLIGRSRSEATINGIPSGEAVLRFSGPGERNFFVAATDGRNGIDFRTASVKVLPSNVPECAGRSNLVLYSRALDKATYRFEVLDAHLVTPDTYLWDFGDGQTLETKTGVVDHSFLPRLEDRDASVFQVNVTGMQRGVGGARARTTIALTNSYYSAARVGSPQLPVEHSGHFKKTVADPKTNIATYEAQITFTNPDSSPVRLDRATVSLTPCGTGDVKDDERDAGSLLEQTTVAAQKRTTIRLRLPPSVEDLCAIRITFSGDSEPPRAGSAVPDLPGATFARTTAFVDLSRENPNSTGRDRLAAMIRLEKAQLLLGKSDITDDDFRKLDERGLLKGP